MADYLASMRSNYFKVKDGGKFRAFCGKYGLEVIEEKSEDNANITLFGFLCDGPIPTGYTNAKGDYVEADFTRALSRHLVEGEVAVLMEVGQEKMRYLIGFACAVNWRGKLISVSLNEIYAKARKLFGVEPTLAEY